MPQAPDTSPRPQERSRVGIRWLAGGAVVGALQLAALWLTDWPLGVPGEWTWARSDLADASLETLLPALILGGLLLGFAAWGGRRAKASRRGARAARLLALWALGTGWLFALVAAAPGIAGVSRGPFVLYYTRSSGYFWQARYEAESLGAFLRTYEERIQDSSVPENYLHQGTHPPGLTAGFLLLLDIVESAPGLRAGLLATQPTAFRESIDVVREGEARSGRTLRDVDSATLWLAMLIVAAANTATLLPLYRIARRCVDAEAAWWTAAFWLTVPASAVFIPKSDALLPLLALLAQWLWLEALDRGSWKWGALAGAASFASLLISLAFLPVGLMLALQFAAAPGEGHSAAGSARLRRFGRDWTPVAGAAAVFVVGLLLFRVLAGLNLLGVWAQNVRNHAAFYDHATRTWRWWLLANPLELGFALGLPLGLLGLGGLWQLARFRGAMSPSPAPSVPETASRRWELAIPAIVWAILWLSGKNMGEAARLWIFLMPFAVLYAGLTIDRLRASGRARAVFWLFAVQVIVAVGTAARIDGFHFGELIGGGL